MHFKYQISIEEQIPSSATVAVNGDEGYENTYLVGPQEEDLTEFHDLPPQHGQLKSLLLKLKFSWSDIWHLS